MNPTKVLLGVHKVKITFLLCVIGIYLIVFICGLSVVLFGRKNKESLIQPVSKKMYRVFIHPPPTGLGNKLFHLASCYGIALTNKKLVISPKFSEKIKTLLNISCLDVEIANAPNETKIQKSGTMKKYHPQMEHLIDTDIYLAAYIPVMKYFLPYASSMKNSTVINDNLVGSAQQFLHSLHLTANTTYAGMHIRRGD